MRSLDRTVLSRRQHRVGTLHSSDLRSPSSHGVRIGRKTSRVRGTSDQRVGRFSYSVIAKRLVQKRFSARSRISSYRLE